MLRSLALSLCPLLLIACGGPRTAGPHEGERVIWKVALGETSFDNCTDEPEFRDPLMAFALQDGTYLAYEVDDEAKSARELVCTAYDTSACDLSPDGVKFDIVDKKLVLLDSVRQEIEGWDCSMEVNATWNIADEGETAKMDIAFLYAFVDGADCARLQTHVVETSQNGMGLDGCSVTRHLKGTLP